MNSQKHISSKGLKRAIRQLSMMEDVHLDQDGSIPMWITSAKWAVEKQLQERHND